MGIVDSIVSPAEAQHVALLRHLIFFMLVLHLPYIGLLLVASVASVITAPWRKSLSERLIHLGGRTVMPTVVFGVLPLLCLIFLFGQYVHGSDLPATDMLEITALVSFGGQLLLVLYRRTKAVALGAAGHGLLLLGAFFLSAFLTLLAFPERWPLLALPVPYPFSWLVIWEFALLSTTAALLGGAAILFVYFGPSQRRVADDDPDRGALRWLGIGLLLAGSLGSAPLLVFDFASLYTPNNLTGFNPALGPIDYVLGVIIALLLGAVFLSALSMIDRMGHGRIARVSVLSFLVFGLLVFKSFELQAAANADFAAAFARRAEEVRMAWQSEQEKRYTQAEPDLAVGEQIYNQRCTACHKWETKLVGPPHMSVLPKYEGKTDELVKFVVNPVRVDTSYPPMPSQGLNELEAQSVVLFLQTEYDKRVKEAGQ